MSCFVKVGGSETGRTRRGTFRERVNIIIIIIFIFFYGDEERVA